MDIIGERQNEEWCDRWGSMKYRVHVNRSNITYTKVGEAEIVNM